MTSKIGKYDVLEVLGRGGMGVVYKVYDPILDREVALKTMTAEGLKDPVLRERFYREARAAGRLRHPNIVTIYELGEEGDMPFITMEYLPGTDIHQIIRSREDVSFESKIRIIAQLCRGLAFAHKGGIVHRDIKPSNIRLTEDHHVKILDFGIARLVTSQTVTTNGMVLGTIHYMSPEQIKSGQHVDRKSDIFSAGIIFYELLTYKKPFEGDNTASILYNILHEPAQPMDPPIDEQFPALKRVLQKSLDKDPARRYFSADEMADDLEQFLRQVASLNKPGSPVTVEYAALAGKSEVASQGTSERPKTDPRALDLLRTAKRHVMEGRSVQAVTSLRQALVIDPQNAEAKQLMQIVEHDIKKAEAEELLRHGQNYLREGRYDIAQKVFEKILKIDPNHSKAKMLLETLQTEMIPEIEELLEKAKKAYSEKKYHLAREYLEDVLKTVPEHQEAQEIMLLLKERLTAEEFNEFLQSAENFMREEQYETAIKALEKALKIFPQHPVALKWMENAQASTKKSQMERFRGLGNKQLELGNYGDARESFENILRLDPQNATAKMVLSRIQEKIKLEEIRQLLNEGWRTLMMDKKFDEVIRIAEKILELDPDNTEARSLISQAQKETET